MKLYLIVIVEVLLFLFGQAGKSAEKMEVELSWKQAEEALKSKEFHAVRDLFLHFSKLPIATRFQKAYADPTLIKDFDSVAKYMKMFYTNATFVQEGREKGLDMRTEAIQERASKEINWTGTDTTLSKVVRVYTLQTYFPTEAERIFQWDRIVYFKVFTDGDGKILGWRRLSDVSE
jgi:hypothetical protein